jgi:outer membrane receptor for ferrienterochelin and colicin
VAAAPSPVGVLARLLALACAVGFQTAIAAGADAGSLADLSLEELSNVQITSVSKRAERLSDAAASVFVITADDIRRSGVRRLPDALRLAPNLQRVPQGSEGQPPPGTVSVSGVPEPLGNVSISGANLTARWDRTLEGGSSLSFAGLL